MHNIDNSKTSFILKKLLNCFKIWQMKTYLHNACTATQSQIGKKPNIHPEMNKLQYFHMTEYYSGTEKNELLTQAKQMNLKNALFGPSWSARDKIYLPTWNNYNTEQDIENKGFQTRGWMDMRLCPGSTGLGLLTKEKYKEGEPYDCPDLRTGEFPDQGRWEMQTEPGSLLARWWRAESLGRRG